MKLKEWLDKGDLIQKVEEKLVEAYKKREITDYEEAITFARETAEELGGNFDEATDTAMDAWEKFISDYNLFVCDICGEIRDGDEAISLADGSEDTEKLSHALERESERYGADCFTGDRVNMAECICEECRSRFLVLDYEHRIEHAIENHNPAELVEVEKANWQDLYDRLEGADRETIGHLFRALGKSIDK